MSYFETAKTILRKINSYGYKAYIVGGAVRDYLLNIDIKDIDITSNMPLDFLITLFDCDDTNIKYHNVIAKINNYEYEITHFRCDISYTNNRFAKSIITDDINLDAKRRDFTINSLYMDCDNNIIDLYDGIKDLNNKVIKCIGNPDIRFEEDALRILRALYFSSKLDFKIESNTLNSMIKNKNLINNLSSNRIYDMIIDICYNKYDKGIKYTLDNNILDGNNLKLFNLAVNRYNKDDLKVYYYLKYNSYYDNTSNYDKRRIKSILFLQDNNFNKYSIFKVCDMLFSIYEIINTLYNIDILKIYNNLNIKSINDIKLSKDVIFKYCKNEQRKEILDYIIKNILDGNILNEEEQIKKLCESFGDCSEK